MNFNLINHRALDSGGFGDVFLAEREDTGETVVVKYLRDFQDQGRRKWFKREIRILLQRAHDRLVPLLAAAPDALRPYYVMPYFAGGSLAAMCGRLGPQEFIRTAQQIAEPLAALHANNVAHGDIKPDNVLLSNQGTVHVADPLGNGGGCTVTFNENQGGTPGYLAPEGYSGSPISPAVDVFAFGATLFHMATGSRPAEQQDFDTRRSGRDVPESIRVLILACTHDAPEQRPTMATVVAYLRQRVSPADWAACRAEHGGMSDGARLLLIIGAAAALGLLLWKVIEWLGSDTGTGGTAQGGASPVAPAAPAGPVAGPPV